MINIIISGLSSLDHNYGAQGILLPFLSSINVNEELHFRILLSQNTKHDPELLKEFSYEIIKVPRVNFTSFHKLKKIKRIIKQSDIVIDLNGIEFLGDRSFLTKWKDLLTTTYYSYNARKEEKLYLKYSKSYGPFVGRIYRKTIRNHFNSLPFLLVRGKKNKRIVESLNLDVPVYSFPDISFALQTASQEWCQNYLHNVSDKIHNGFICYSPSVVINNLAHQNGMGGQNYLDFSIKLIQELQKTGKNIVLLPHSIGNGESIRHCDLALSKIIFDKLENSTNIFLIDDTSLTYGQARAIIKSSSFYITGRYHSLTSALVNLVPVVPLSWHVKYSDVINMFTKNDVSINVNKTSSEEAISQIIDRYNDRNWYNVDEMRNNKVKVLNEVQKSMDLINSEIIKWRKSDA